MDTIHADIPYFQQFTVLVFGFALFASVLFAYVWMYRIYECGIDGVLHPLQRIGQALTDAA